MRCSEVREAGVGARRRSVVLVAALVLLAGLLAACSSASAKPVLTWYINPDTGGQDAVAAAVQHEPVHDHDAGAPHRRRPATDPAGPPPGRR